MAPELAINALSRLKASSMILDPMVGSGTVVRHALEFGHRAKGFDLDPLAVLMTKVWTTSVSEPVVDRLCHQVVEEVKATSTNIGLPWIDEDEETKRFSEFWFGEAQRSDLRRISFVLAHVEGWCRSPTSVAAANILRLALSRIIITKEKGASLARDVSHSRPHKVAEQSSFDVLAAFERSITQVRRLLTVAPITGTAQIKMGDARSLRSVNKGTIDVVLTSPPYLNAIDYMRGHRLSLIWLGYRLAELRAIRTTSIGAERSNDVGGTGHLFGEIQASMCDIAKVPKRHAAMILRYAEDVYRFMSEVARVLRPDGKAILVVGDSCLQGNFVRNSRGVAHAASLVGLRLTRKVERELPSQHRYLPMPRLLDVPLGGRMRTETVLSFRHK